MRKLLITLLLLTPSLAIANEPCNRMMDTSMAIMELRQMGLHKEAVKGGLAEQGLSIYAPIVDAAYNEPLAPERHVNDVVTAFGVMFYKSCMEVLE